MDLSSSSTDEQTELRCVSSELLTYTVHHNSIGILLLYRYTFAETSSEIVCRDSNTAVHLLLMYTNNSFHYYFEVVHKYCRKF